MTASRVLRLLAVPLAVCAAEGRPGTAEVGGNLSLQDDTEPLSCELEASDAQVMMLQTALNGQDFLASDLAVRNGTANSSTGLITNGRPAPIENTGGWHLGKSSCPCIGIKGREGHVSVTLDNTDVSFPIDVGSSCQLWDHNRNPSCVGANAPLLDPAWCIQTWCFVDPCNCRLPSGLVPKVSSYFPYGEIQDAGVYYSYETCGENDLFTSTVHLNACVNQKTTTDCFKTEGCAWTLDKGCVGEELAGSACATNFIRNAAIWGFSDCACVGISNLTGSVDATIGNDTVSYPASTGSTCRAWDNDHHPDCVNPSGEKPSWCTRKWCNVDPCKCIINTPPKISTYFHGAMWLSHQVYYSYATCGEEDSYTEANNPTACTNQADQASCESMPNKCAWTTLNSKLVCVGIDLATLCLGHRPVVGGAAPAASGRVLAAAAPLLTIAGLGRHRAGA